eukprot:scaffold36478_cov60-Phaeocystis_antarctica.AAC.1
MASMGGLGPAVHRPQLRATCGRVRGARAEARAGRGAQGCVRGGGLPQAQHGPDAAACVWLEPLAAR